MALFDRLKALVASSRLNVATRFALLEEATSATMSRFYKARDLRSGKIVGLKLLDIEKTAAFEARFKGHHKPSEGEIACQLKHPRIVETYEFGTTTTGAHFLVMEYLEGADLSSLLGERNFLLEDNRLRLIREAAEAVAAVHAAGFIHRDISARNFFVTKDGKDLKLFDFGLTVPATPPFMQPGVRVGNPNYMAPEVVRRKPIDQRLDVFAFGVTAYEICTGHTPWPPGRTGMAAMSHDKPPADIRQHRPTIHPSLAKAIHWCLEAEASHRCGSMETFLSALRGVKHEDAAPGTAPG